MELWLYDNSTSTRRTVRVDAEPIVIGRNDDCDVVLQGPFVGRRHAAIVRRGNQFFVENLGRSGTRIANREILTGKPARVDFGDEIQIGQFSLALIRPDGGAGSERDPAGQDRFELHRQLMDFEQQIHAELLERMNLRVTASINKSDAAFVNQILSHLEEVLNIRCRRLEDELVVYTCRTHLHRLVTAEVVRQCQGRFQTDYRASDERLLDPKHEPPLRLMRSGADARR